MSGELIIIAAPMRADSAIVPPWTRTWGKTGAAIALCWEAEKQHGPGAAIAIQPANNTRDGGDLVARSGERYPAMVLQDAYQITGTLARSPARLVVIEEAHLWEHPQILIGACAALRARGMRVILLGVPEDHMGQPFEWWQLAQGVANRVHRLTGRCQCGRRSTRTFRHGLSNARVLVDDLGHYEGVCWVCWLFCRLARSLRSLFRVEGQREERTVIR